MDPDPMEFVEEDEPEEETTQTEDKPKRPLNSLNTLVALLVALLATFMGICQVKSGNIVQAMQQAQVDKIDNYAWYQARNLREEIARANVANLTAQAAAAPPQAQAAIQEQIKIYQGIAADQENKKKVQQTDAENADKAYQQLNIHDDQFDVSDAMLALAISLLALTALTQKRWLFGIAMVPTALGVLMGLAGLLELNLKLNFISKLLS
jgi:molecular chaperone GrpE (heat shock protein)